MLYISLFIVILVFSCLSLFLYFFIIRFFVLILFLRLIILLFSKIFKFWNCDCFVLELSLVDSWFILVVCFCIFFLKEVIWCFMLESLMENDIRVFKVEFCEVCCWKNVRSDILGKKLFELKVYKFIFFWYS